MAPPHPGIALADTLASLGLSQAEAARRMGVNRVYLHQIRAGRKPLSLPMCVRLATLTGTSAEAWATRQMRYDLWHATQTAAKKWRPHGSEH